ncbi:MAG: hypothetical protein J6Y95_07200 [Lachnospiraceae bacterium]|nr:hypothetical protein [Lachnospiraceae bacterium]
MGRTATHDLKSQVENWVYIGPTIRSAIQHNTILTGTREEVEKKLAYAIEKYPPIAQLLISSDELARARQLIKQPGNRLYEVYRRFVAGFNNVNGG